MPMTIIQGGIWIRLLYILILALACMALSQASLGVSVDGGTSASLSSGLVGGELQADSTGTALDAVIASSVDMQNNYLVEDISGNLLTAPGSYAVRPGTGVISSAVKAAKSGDNIELEYGKYIDNIEIDKSLKIGGTCDCNKVVVEGADSGGSVFKIIPGVEVTLSNMIIQGGTGTPGSFGVSGGGIYNQGILNLMDSTVGSADKPNTAQYGGGIFNDGGALYLSRCSVESNRAVSSGTSATSGGGGIFNYHGSVIISGCTIKDNRATSYTDGAAGDAWAVGGAINNAGPLSIYSSSIKNNAAIATSTYGRSLAEGGGIHSTEGGIVNLNSGGDLSYNAAIASTLGDDMLSSAYGGGVSISSGILNLNPGSRILNNNAFSSSSGFEGTAQALGGGVWIDQGTDMTSKRSKAYYNSANANGYESFAYGGGIFSRGSVTLESSKITMNSAGLGGGVFNSQGQLNADTQQVTDNTPDNIYSVD
jgi:hypothetical protein